MKIKKIHSKSDFIEKYFYLFVPRVAMVVVTDGQSQDEVSASAENMRNNGVVMAAVGYAGAVVEELNVIANDPDEDFVFLGNTAEDLLELSASLTETICTTQPASRSTDNNSSRRRLPLNFSIDFF